MDTDGSTSCPHPTGDYKVFVRVLDTTSDNMATAGKAYVYTESGWQFTEDFGTTGPTTADLGIAVPVTIEAGATTTLETLKP